ncbi:sigma-70 family RNA polymerase sigma factor [Brevibacillus sp. SYP-B805]|nr:sigma-70 family RNA polymerase sigma factor [Brevibacillus sp. SYP-B805]
MDDSRLVERAKTGDQEAFGELVRRHRARLYGYVQSVTREPFIAEDIVQEALIRAFLHLGMLMDSRRFLPWLHTIVRNQAYTRMKKSGYQANERAFSTLAPTAEGSGQTDWSSLDSILGRLARSVSRAALAGTNPEEVLVRKELLATIEGMLGCLNPRERRVFESHFFDHLSPQEIAKLFDLSSANVYQILSRSKKKLLRHKTLATVDDYLKDRKDRGCMKTMILPKPNLPGPLTHTWTSCAWAMYAMLAYTDKPYSLPMVMGLSGHAFRINVMPGEIHIAGPTMYDFAGLLGRGLANLGFHVRTVHHRLQTGPGENSNLVAPSLIAPEAREKRELPTALPEALELIHRSIDQGVPVVSWDLFIPEFGIIYGYDDEQRLLMAADNCGHDKPIPFDHLGRGLIQELFVLALDRRAGEGGIDVGGALDMILAHYRGEEPREPGCINGLDAYDAWCEAYQAGTIEPNGNAYNLAVVHDARRYAAAFLKELADLPEESFPGGEEVRALCREAAAHCTETAAAFSRLCSMFPFPAGGEPHDRAQAQAAVHQLQAAKAHEQQTLAALEKMHRFLR